MLFIHQYPDWTHFRYDLHAVMQALSSVRAMQGHFSGRVSFALGEERSKECRLRDWQALLAIDGVRGDIRSAVSKRLQDYNRPLGLTELCSLHSALGYSGYLREDSSTGVEFITKSSEKVRFTGVAPDRVSFELSQLLEYFNTSSLDPVLVSAIVHFWFLTIRPFQSGNGCIARILCDMGLSKSESSAYRFYSVFEKIFENQEDYFSIIQRAWVGRGDITEWLLWFLEQMKLGILEAENHWKLPLEEASYKLRLGEMPLSSRELSLLDFSKEFPRGISSSDWSKKKGISHDSALRDFKSLIEKGIFEKIPETKGRNTKYRIKKS